MQENPAIILAALTSVGVSCALSTICIYKQNYRKLKALTKIFITLSLTIKISIPLLNVELFALKGPLLERANLL